MRCIFPATALLLLGSSTFAYVHDTTPDGLENRLCPDGFWYAGEDTKLEKDWIGQVISRSPVYSCYNVSLVARDYFKASAACEDAEAHLISLEDEEEIQRFKEKLLNLTSNQDSSLMTSAIYFAFEDQWRWMGSNKTFDTDMLDIDNLNGSCLAIDVNGEFFTLPCDQKSIYACEARVQTVEWMAWFVGNWFSLLLVFLVVVLLISLCISASMYSRQRRNYSGRIYRSTGPVFEDKPPSYNRATGQSNRYLTKGREFLAKVNPRQTENRA